MKFPKALGACIDLCYKLRSKRLELESKADELRAEQKALEDHIIQSFAKSEIDGAKGSVATAAVTHTLVPTVTDYEAFAKYILRTGEIDLLERRPSRSACKERWDDGVALPGVEPFDRVGLSLTKVGVKE